MNEQKKIVLAEDDPFISRMYLTKLEQAGYTTRLAANGRDAVEAIAELHPDLVMLDINMPELSGFEVVRTLQASGYDFSSTIVVVLTNSADPKDRSVAEGLGFDYLVKAEMTPKSVLDHINEKLWDASTSQPAS